MGTVVIWDWPMLALLVAAVALLAFFGGYLIGHWHADQSRDRAEQTWKAPPARPDNSHR
ncbi:hypothetical protein ACFT2C_04740 [Promicromonospora sp. NPDC057138]|uniref:hypothetical protein n=1 Tax=Promicromonospora sp. NPDC057138 TaxID=3346031 RepID=UPI003631D06C